MRALDLDLHRVWLVRSCINGRPMIASTVSKEHAATAVAGNPVAATNSISEFYGLLVRQDGRTILAEPMCEVVEAPAAADTWISVKDRLPEHGQRVLVYVPSHEGYNGVVPSLVEIETYSGTPNGCVVNWGNDFDGYLQEEAFPTHWKPIHLPDGVATTIEQPEDIDDLRDIVFTRRTSQPRSPSHEQPDEGKTACPCTPTGNGLAPAQVSRTDQQAHARANSAHDCRAGQEGPDCQDGRYGRCS